MDRDTAKRRELKTSHIVGGLLLVGGAMFLADTLYVLHEDGTSWPSLCKSVVFSSIGLLVFWFGRVRD